MVAAPRHHPAGHVEPMRAVRGIALCHCKISNNFLEDQDQLFGDGP
jgi:hypothetical protein